jgi:hypothetical protein
MMIKDYKHMRLTEEPVNKLELKYYLITVVLLFILCIDKI